MTPTLVSASTPLGLLLVALIAVVIPFLVDLVTKKFAESGTKAAVLLALSLVNGVVMEWLAAVNANVAWDWESALTTALFSFLTSVGVFYGLTKPAKLNGADGPLATRAGVGATDPKKVAMAANPPLGAAPVDGDLGA